MKMMQQSSGMDMSLIINPAMQQAQELAINLQSSKEQMQKVKALSQIFNAEIPMQSFKHLLQAHIYGEGADQT